MPAIKKKAESTDKPTVTDTDANKYVYVEKSVTKNLENYNSARVVVGMSLPIHPTKEDLAQAKKTITVITTVLDDYLVKEIDALMTEA